MSSFPTVLSALSAHEHRHQGVQIARRNDRSWGTKSRQIPAVISSSEEFFLSPKLFQMHTSWKAVIF